MFVRFPMSRAVVVVGALMCAPRSLPTLTLLLSPQAEKAELKSALLEAVASALYYNPQLALQWTEANNATQVCTFENRVSCTSAPFVCEV